MKRTLIFVVCELMKTWMEWIKERTKKLQKGQNSTQNYAKVQLARILGIF